MDLHHALFWACLVITCIAELLILRAAFFPRTTPATSADLPHSPRGLEMLWGVLPAIVLAVLYWVAWARV